jgi:hypothetical protein
MSDSHATLEGAVPALATPQERCAAFDQAFDYRGDVTITTTDGRTLEGYVFDRRSDADRPYVRLLPKDSNLKTIVHYDEIARLTFSGRDTAAGKSWETWLKKYVETKLRGEIAELKPESLD